MKLGRSWGQLGMKSEWNIGTISEVCSLVTDGSHYSPKSCDNGEYMVSVKDFKGFGFDFSNCKHISSSDYEKMKASGCIPECGDILIGKDGARFFEDIIIYNQPEKPALLSSIAILRCNPDIILPQFLYYICKNPVFKKDVRDNYGSGSAIPRIVLKDFKRMPISYPDLDEQRKIVASLVAIDDRILLNTAINENLESQAQAIFKAWFVDFEPFGGVMPEDWRIGSLSEICGYSKDKVNIEDLTLDTYYSTENMQPNRQGAVQATTLPTIKQTTACKKGDVLISNIRPYFKKIIYCFADCGCSTDVLCFVPNKSEYSAFLYCALYSNKFFDYMVAGSKGTKMPRGDKQQIMMYPICIPSTEYVEQFSKIVAPMLETVYTNRLEANDLAILRDTLLPKLMNGEIDVSEVKI